MNTQEFFTITHSYRPNLKRLLANIINKKLGTRACSDRIEETLSEIIVSTAEKIEAGKLNLNSQDEVEMYLTRSAWYDFKNNGLKRQKELRTTTSFNENTYQDLPDTETEEDPIITDTSEVYKRIFEYVYSKYPHEEAGLYKAHTINGFTFDQLAEATLMKRYRCYDIVKKIRADVQANKEWLLSGLKTN